MGTVNHTEPDAGRLRLRAACSSQVLTAWERGQHTQGHTKVTLGSRANQQELWEAGSVLKTGCSDPWFPPEDMAGLFEGFCRLAENGSLLPAMHRPCAWSL